MKFVCLQENLEKALALINRTASVKTQLPITSNVLIKTTKNEITFTGTDLENTVHVTVAGKIEEEGGVLLPIRTLTEVISALPKEQVEVSGEGLVITVKSGKYEVKIHGYSQEEFPQPPKIEGGKRDISEVLPYIKTVSFAAAIDESRAALTGILFLFGKKELTLVATDGYRLSLKKVVLPKSKEDGEQFIVPGRILSEIAKIDTQIASLIIGDTKNQVLFSLDDVEVYSRLIEGNFPAYEKIIPQTFDTKAVVDLEEFAKAVKLSAVFARESANIVKLKFGKRQLTVSANAPQVGENTCEVEADITGDENEIAFNSRFLLDLLSNVHAKEVVFEMTGPLNPGVFKIAGEDSYLHIIMPVRVQQ